MSRKDLMCATLLLMNEVAVILSIAKESCTMDGEGTVSHPLPRALFVFNTYLTRQQTLRVPCVFDYHDYNLVCIRDGEDFHATKLNGPKICIKVDKSSFFKTIFQNLQAAKPTSPATEPYIVSGFRGMFIELPTGHRMLKEVSVVDPQAKPSAAALNKKFDPYQSSKRPVRRGEYCHDQKEFIKYVTNRKDSCFNISCLNKNMARAKMSLSVAFIFS
ncbi:hypothetical protein E3N88_01980 [Mikania micrantha]|uniref:Uncharacterized protein n=1 Tax=Mikania micrantha TaxID=192012 RepID=A0A5N6Q2H6_9ASTR|nr:hypothetical protein E3N88_01980 [Mikania micrantha]